MEPMEVILSISDEDSTYVVDADLEGRDLTLVSAAMDLLADIAEGVEQVKARGPLHVQPRRFTIVGKE